mgnify:CR=1 FL=1
MKLKAIGKHVLVENMEKGEQRTPGGIVIPDDNGKLEGIRARWGKVHAIGPDVQAEISVGEWVLAEHGRWTRPLEMFDEDRQEKFTLWGVEEESILCASGEQPVEFSARY